MNPEVTRKENQNDEGQCPSHLFLLRIWPDRGTGQKPWHGKVQDAVTGEARTFHGCAELKRLIENMMGPVGQDRSTK